MRKIAKFFGKMLLSSVLMLMVSGFLVYWLTGLNPAGLLKVSGEASEMLKIRTEMSALQNEYARLNPSDSDDFAKIEDLVNKQRELQAELMKQLSSDDLQKLKQGGEKLTSLFEKLQKQAWFKRTSKASKEFYEEQLKPHLEE